jgi:hypothetical protein
MLINAVLEPLQGRHCVHKATSAPAAYTRLLRSDINRQGGGGPPDRLPSAAGGACRTAPPPEPDETTSHQDTAYWIDGHFGQSTDFPDLRLSWIFPMTRGKFLESVYLQTTRASDYTNCTALFPLPILTPPTAPHSRIDRGRYKRAISGRHTQ